MVAFSRRFLLIAWMLHFFLLDTIAQGDSEVRWESVKLRGYNQVQLVGELGRVNVPARHAQPNDESFEIAFVRLRTTNPRPAPPIIFLAGGPGGSGVEIAAVIATHPHLRLLEHADVIGIDQRGTGLSRPNLMTPEFEEQISWDVKPSRSDYLDSFQRCVTRCLQHCRAEGIDPLCFNSQESAADVDTVRKALAIDKVVLLGSSYGSHLGLAYLARYDRFVARAVLSKVEGLDQTWKVASTTQLVLEQVEKACAEDLFFQQRVSGLTETIIKLRRRLTDDRIAVALVGDDGKPREIVLSDYELLMAIANWLADTDGISKLPKRLDAMQNGDWSELASFSRESRRVAIQAMPLLMDCASSASAQRLKRIVDEQNNPQNILADALNAPFLLETCSACGGIALDDEFRKGTPSEVPILFTSGSLDIRTPPENVRAIIDHYPNAVHIVANNASHDSREWMSSEYRRILQAFLRGETVTSCEIMLPAIFFERP
jgi:pimeloyl-ACP methyl ester carboxylesterase